MENYEQRISLSSEKYLEYYSIYPYLEDAIAQLLEHSHENPKVVPTKFLSDYFLSIKEGNHVLFREFFYVKSTYHNRSSFIKLVWNCFKHVGRKGDLLNVKEYHSLLCLLCPDFPLHLVQKTSRIILMDDASDCLLSFSDFIYSFQIQFIYDEFLTRCAEIYKHILQSPSKGALDTVVVPTSDTPTSAHSIQSSKTDSSGTVEGVEAQIFNWNIVSLYDKLDISLPPVSIVREILNSVETVTFYGFLLALSKNTKLNKFIGKVPSKDNLYSLVEKE